MTKWLLTNTYIDGQWENLMILLKVNPVKDSSMQALIILTPNNALQRMKNLIWQL